ncbi:NRDE-2, necessary for RNA interference-domain-containing protein [Thamnocephalis sphaerospora]|uniref:NRDE-2, necessary for RNA interference-domain-containing protein n=1 Tax=Thamnocephalis sphaerospora TaxID=78915 RepID=A0A4P9XT07_9FUNG|nr:NRDE-2, necessary for RNA interference-domain-containing protein [Thamnocephalis sphaerospora]|eukprot:RKP08540.1 NRDE-2, necessary for RNA interference-domain-containing protein [Thamnocephalis sphaerospora]
MASAESLNETSANVAVANARVKVSRKDVKRREARSRSRERSRSPRRHKKRSRRSDRDRTRTRSSSRSSSDDLDERYRRRHRQSHRHDDSRTRKDSSSSRRKHAQSTKQDSGPTDNSMFFTDTTGDRHNDTYESMYRYDVPRYRAREVRPVLGAALYVHATRDAHGEISSLRIASEGPRPAKPTRYMDAKYTSLTSEPPSASAEPELYGMEFISVPKASNEQNGERDSRALPVDVGESSARDQALARLRAQVAQLECALQVDPEDVDQWLQLVALQEQVVGQSGRRKLESRRATIEVKMSVFEKALQHCPGDARLIAGYLECCEEILDTSHVLTKWEQIVAMYSSQTLLWLRYLDFRQRHFSSFNVTACVQVYSRCLGVLRERIFTSSDRDSAEMEALQVFERGCRLLADAGYTERAIACYQAVLELAFFGPESSNRQQWDTNLERFEEYWEAMLPRVGEKGACGWLVHLQGNAHGQEGLWDEEMAGTRQEEYSKGAEDDTEVRTGTDAYLHRWTSIERKSAEDGRFPRQSLEEDEADSDSDVDSVDEDPYRVATFDDVQPFLLPFSSPRARLRLILALLALLGVPISASLPSSDPMAMDAHMHDELLDTRLCREFFPEQGSTASGQPVVMLDGVPVVPETGSAIHCLHQFPLHNYPQHVYSVDCSHAPPAVQDFCRRALAQLAQDRYDTQLYALYLTSLLPDYARRAQAILHSMASLAASSPIAFVELRAHLDALSSQNPEQHGAALRSILRSAACNTDQPLRNTAAATRPFVELQMKSKRHGQALAALMRAALSDGAAECATDSEEETDVAWTPIQKLRVRKHNQQHRMFRPATLRTVLERALTLFPNNTNLLSLYLYSETRFKIENRVRRFLDTMLSSTPSCILWLFRIFAELHFSRDGCNSHQVRALFEDAVRCQSTTASPSIWSAYIAFELRQKRPSKAKKVLFRALSACPWHKELCMLAFSLPTNTLTAEECQEVVDLMMEREMRLRISPEVPPSAM